MNYEQRRYLLLALDPVHIGTGGYRLGRVDLSIAREPGTNLPKIPGTSLSGAVRSYAAMQYNKPDCAGQGQSGGGRQEHCGNRSCPICYTFGFAKGNGGYAGTVGLTDAQLLFFPVYSMAGPVWVSTAERLAQAGFSPSADAQASDKARTSLTNWDQDSLNLGWLLLSIEKNLQVTSPSGWGDNQNLWQAIKDRLVLVPEKLFAQVVNSNLEVRTSVSINPHTGAADDGALFTYEAIPRSAWLYFDVIEDDYRGSDTSAGGTQSRTWSPLGVVEKGLDMIQYLGVGGMGTRGFGRVQQIFNWKVAGGES